jgi:class 3 adenylate cyclase/Zn finger protein HypA/HybF involved in hydrogenase expression
MFLLRRYSYFFFIFLLFFACQSVVMAQDVDKLVNKYNQLKKELKDAQAYKPPTGRRRPNQPAPKAPRDLRIIRQDMAKNCINLADAYLAIPDYRNAISHYNEATRISDDISDFGTSAVAHRKLGDHYTKNNIYASAIRSYLDATEHYKKAKKYAPYIEVLLKMARLHIGKEENKKAISVLAKTMQEAEFYKEVGKLPECYELFALAYTKEGDTEMANKYKSLSKGSQDMVAKNQEQIAERETAKQEVEKLEEKQDVIEVKLKQGNLSSTESEELKQQVAVLEREKQLAEQKVRINDEKLKIKMEQIKAKDEELFKSMEKLSDSQEKQKQQQQQILILAGVGVIMLLFIIFMIIAAIRIRQANRKLAAQNIEISKQAKEIELQKLEIENERDKSETLLLNILPAAVATELKEKGFAVPKQYEQVSVLFGDFKGFTNVAEKLTPKEIINELNICFSAFDAICEKYRLERIKTIGDAYMCAGGLPKANDTNALDAVLAALEMQEFLKNRKTEKESYGEEYFEMRIGIHTGAVVAGVVGTKKFAYDIWGDTVNLASRMESSGEVGMVNISETTYRLVKDDIYCAYRGEIPAKNKGNVAMYFAVSKW